MPYATTQRNLGIAHEDSGDLPTAIISWREAERCYRLIGAIEDAALMRRWIEEAEASAE